MSVAKARGSERPPDSILIIDDDQGMCETVTDILEHRGYEVDGLTLGREAIQRLETRQFSAAIVDIRLPDISGLELLDVIRRASAGTEVILITAHATLSSAIAAINGHAFAYLTKPFDMDHLVVTLGKAMEHRRLTRALGESEASLRALVNASPLAIMALDLDGYVRTWSAGATQMFGWQEEEVIGRPLPTVPDGEREGFNAIVDRARHGEPTTYETRRRRKDGALLEVSVSAAPIRGVEGRIAGSMAVVEDIGERKQLEAQLRQAQKLEAIGQLAGGVAHDFNNLLTVISGRAYLLLERQGTDPAHPDRRDIELIQKTAHRAAALTRQLLAFSRKQALQLRVLNLDIVAANIAPMLRRLIGEDIELVVRSAADRWMTRADPNQIEQVILNLAVNARDAMPEGGRLTIETDRLAGQRAPSILSGLDADRDYVVLSIADTGTGMDAATCARAFEPFFTTKEPGKGTGLGLSTVDGIVRQHGGVVRIESEVGVGTTFRIYFPRTTDVAAPARPRLFTAQAPTGHETILLAEDEEPVRTLIKEILAGAGYAVLEATSGPAALDRCRAHMGPIDLLVTDVVMPEMSGTQLARQARALRPEIRVLFISGYTADALGPHGIIEQEVALLRKPFDPDTLLQTIRQVIGRR